MAEETRDPRQVARWGMVIALGVSGVVGYILLLAMTLTIRSVPAVLVAHDSQGNAVAAAIAILWMGLRTAAHPRRRTAGTQDHARLVASNRFLTIENNGETGREEIASYRTDFACALSAGC